MSLILTRRKGEGVVVGNHDQQITIRIHEVNGGKIRLSFDGPRSMTVMREETFLSMMKEAKPCEQTI